MESTALLSSPPFPITDKNESRNWNLEKTTKVLLIQTQVTFKSIHIYKGKGETVKKDCQLWVNNQGLEKF